MIPDQTGNAKARKRFRAFSLDSIIVSREDNADFHGWENHVNHVTGVKNMFTTFFYQVLQSR